MIREASRLCLLVLLSLTVTAAVIFLRTVYAAHYNADVDDIGAFDTAELLLGTAYILMTTILPGFAWCVGNGSKRPALALMRDMGLWLLVTVVFSIIPLYVPMQFIVLHDGIYYKSQSAISNSVVTSVVFLLVPLVFFVARFLIIVSADYSSTSEDAYPKELTYTDADVRAYLSTYVHTAAYASAGTCVPALKVDDDEGARVEK